MCVCLRICQSVFVNLYLCFSLSLSSNAQRNAFSFINQFLLIVKESCYHWFSTCIKSETQQLRDMFHFSSSPGFPLVPAGCYSSWVSSSWNRYNVFLLFVVVVVVVVVAILESWRPLKQQQKSFHSRREFVIPDEYNPQSWLYNDTDRSFLERCTKCSFVWTFVSPIIHTSLSVKHIRTLKNFIATSSRPFVTLSFPFLNILAVVVFHWLLTAWARVKICKSTEVKFTSLKSNARGSSYKDFAVEQ